MYTHSQLANTIVGATILASRIRFAQSLGQSALELRREQYLWLVGGGPASLANPHGLGLYHWSHVATWETATLMEPLYHIYLGDLGEVISLASEALCKPGQFDALYGQTLAAYCEQVAVATWGPVALLVRQPTLQGLAAS